MTKTLLKDVCVNIFDCEHKTAPLSDVGFPSIRTPNIGKGRLILDGVNLVSEDTWKLWTKRAVPQHGDLILAREAPAGNIAVVPPKIKLCLGQRTVLIRPDKKKVNSDFLCYYLLSPKMQHELLSKGGGATVAHVNVKDIKNLNLFTLPDLDNQQKIASILSAYDDLIENNLKRIKLLEEIAQRTYEEWFVKFRVNGEELAIDESTGLPEGWQLMKIGDACVVSGGGTPSRAIQEYWDAGKVEWYSPTDLSKSKSIYQGGSADKITELGLSKSSAKLLQPNSFMMTSRATIGLFGIVDKPFCTNQGFINVTPFETEHKEYLFYNFLSRVDEFKGYATGATFPELSKSKFKALEIIWPSDNALSQFHAITASIHKQLATLSKHNNSLKEARDILLPRLMGGEIDVEEAKEKAIFE